MSSPTPLQFSTYLSCEYIIYFRKHFHTKQGTFEGITFDGILRVRAFSRQGTRASSRRYSKCLVYSTRTVPYTSTSIVLSKVLSYFRGSPTVQRCTFVLVRRAYFRKYFRTFESTFVLSYESTKVPSKVRKYFRKYLRTFVLHVTCTRTVRPLIKPRIIVDATELIKVG